MKINHHYSELQDSYLFANIAQKVKVYQEAHPDQHMYRMGIGDVSLPLAPSVIAALHQGVEDQAHQETFHGYLPEVGYQPLREAIQNEYAAQGIDLDVNDIFVSSGASDELGDILHLFDRDAVVMIMEPAYPAYVDANVMDGRKIIHYDGGVLPKPDPDLHPDLIYICSPNNPTGSVMTREVLKEWVDFANATDAVIIFDAAYKAFIEEDLPKSIFEIEGAKTCAIEICSFSKTAGFTGTRLGYTIVPHELVREDMVLHDMWVRNRTTRTNGVSYIIQRGAMAIFTEQGKKEWQANIAVYKQNAKYLMAALDEVGITYVGGKNAPYIWLDCPNGMTGWEFFDYLLNEVQIIGTPGEGFGACGEHNFRLSCFGDPEDTKEAGRRLVTLLKK
ncbi:MAG: LL-diaminopimelate aminotransferase [Catenisphaera adipataccumulans]|jgi:LL-diaminopimelate aminotransferase|uniref:LL-diaminopimelate aminotransferase n=1 Tax=Catenisphaera adipataccumulans TaxID=700500 RepID=UPI003D8DEB43